MLDTGIDRGTREKQVNTTSAGQLLVPRTPGTSLAAILGNSPSFISEFHFIPTQYDDSLSREHQTFLSPAACIELLDSLSFSHPHYVQADPIARNTLRARNIPFTHVMKPNLTAGNAAPEFQISQVTSIVEIVPRKPALLPKHLSNI